MQAITFLQREMQKAIFVSLTRSTGIDQGPVCASEKQPLACRDRTTAKHPTKTKTLTHKNINK